MAKRRLPNTTLKCNPFRTCTKCGVEYKMRCFLLLNPSDFTDAERSTVCYWCTYPNAKNAKRLKYAATTIYQTTKESHYVSRGKVAEQARMRGYCIPPWTDREASRMIYAISAYATEMTGVPHEVDHIIPINHPRVCGLHVPENLRVITKYQNIKKGNRLLKKSLDLAWRMI